MNRINSGLPPLEAFQLGTSAIWGEDEPALPADNGESSSSAARPPAPRQSTLSWLANLASRISAHADQHAGTRKVVISSPISGAPRPDVPAPAEIDAASTEIVVRAHDQIRALRDDTHGIPIAKIRSINQQAIEDVNRLKNRCHDRANIAIANFHSGIDITQRQAKMDSRRETMHQLGDKIDKRMKAILRFKSVRPGASARRDEAIAELHRELCKAIDEYAAAAKEIEPPDKLKRLRLHEAVEDFRNAVENVLKARETRIGKLRNKIFLEGLTYESFASRLYNDTKVRLENPDLELAGSGA